MEERIRWKIPPGSISEPQLWIMLYVKVISTWNAVSKFVDNIKTGGWAVREGRRNQFQFGLACFLYRSKGNGEDKCFSLLKSVRIASQRKRSHPSKYISLAKKKKKCIEDRSGRSGRTAWFSCSRRSLSECSELLRPEFCSGSHLLIICPGGKITSGAFKNISTITCCTQPLPPTIRTEFLYLKCSWMIRTHGQG